ncbi:DUF1801 domain-containing protein [Microbacterium amylolyticum]|uniref:Nucleoid DNA-binding protein n=1 Tax=Microbacterium amylolyticum TaxID=936337 RepID=A0ABS4ZHF0_9MICO|nr:DUF1801 domain-containing protein [Microbacterium amylolyticum]MBP2436699.1 nucleoid DNA-binding protein [Microbacterium amylolyticum]
MEDIAEFIAQVTPAKRKRDAETLLALMAEVTGEKPILTGSIIGFGTYHYRYASGREGDAPATGFAPRKPATTIYLMDGVDAHAEELAHFGPHTSGVGCLYVKDLDVCDTAALRRVIARSYRTLTAGVFGQRASESGE